MEEIIHEEVLSQSIQFSKMDLCKALVRKLKTEYITISFGELRIGYAKSAENGGYFGLTSAEDIEAFNKDSNAGYLIYNVTLDNVISIGKDSGSDNSLHYTLACIMVAYDKIEVLTNKETLHRIDL